MNLNRTQALFTGIIFATLLTFSCNKHDVLKSNNSSPATQEEYVTATRQPDGTLTAGSVTLTAPSTVNTNESFNISAQVSCGRISIERGYILAADGFTRIYKNLSCETANLQWEVVVPFQCYTQDASWTGSLAEPGTYVYQTKHNASDGNCDGLGGQNTTGECSFTGNQKSCFTIEVIDGCQTSFTGQALLCGNERKAVYTFTPKDAQDYIKIQGGLTDFTSDDATVDIVGGNLTASQNTPGGSTNRVIKIEGSVAACETVTITITWNSTNSGGIITGNWSVKDGNGNDIAPAIEGLKCE